MNSHEKIIGITKWIGLLLLFVEVGAIFIVLLGMYFVATEEMVHSTIKGREITSNKNEKQPHLYLVKR
jgi:hypothetical protein